VVTMNEEAVKAFVEDIKKPPPRANPTTTSLKEMDTGNYSFHTYVRKDRYT